MLVARDVAVCSARSFFVDNPVTLIHVLHSCIQYVWMVNIYIYLYLYTKDRALCIPVTTHTLYQSQTHYGFINVYGHQFLCN